jgi:hypothetical protein
MIPYLVNMTLCALLLYAVYLGLLEREKMHRFKRLYLLGGLVFAMTVPLLTISPFHSPIRENMEILYAKITETGNVQEYPVAEQQVAFAEETPERFPLSYLLAGLYLAVTFGLIIRMARNLLKMRASAKGNGDFTDYCGVKIVLMKEDCIPHSFGKRIFVNREAYRKGEIPEEILLHELAHIRQKHSLDIIFIELLIAVFWFNPVFYLYRHKIKLNHEFLADEAVLENSGDIFRYQTLLIYTVNRRQTQLKLASNFNYLITKKRFIMMTRTTSRKRALWLTAALTPVLAAAIFAFSQNAAAQNATAGLPEQSVESVSAPKTEPDIIIPGQGVSQELLDEYKAIEKNYLEDIIPNKDGGSEIKWKSKSISEDDWKRMYVIYYQMNKEQRKSMLIIWWGPFIHPSGRSVTSVPRKDTWNAWKKPDKYEFRIDGEKADNIDLKSLNRLDYHYFSCKSTESGKENMRIVHLWTKAGVDAWHQQYDKSIPVTKLLEIRPIEMFASARNAPAKETK